MNIDPINCVAIEDSAHGITAAKRAGMFCIGINTADDKKALCDANFVIDRYKDIKLDKLLWKNV